MTNTANILIVDDTPANIRLSVGFLTEKGYKVRPATSGRQALAVAQTDPIDLILLDINMPGLSGDKLAEVLMKTVKSKPVNIVLFSAMDEAELRKKTKESGALGYIPKTFDGNLLRSRVRRFLKKIEEDQQKA